MEYQFKIRTKTKEESANIQTKLFERGFRWSSDRKQTVRDYNIYYLYIDVIYNRLSYSSAPPRLNVLPEIPSEFFLKKKIPKIAKKKFIKQLKDVISGDKYQAGDSWD